MVEAVYLFFEGHWEESGLTLLGEWVRHLPHFLPSFLPKTRQSGYGLRRTFIYFSACPWGDEGTLSLFCGMG